MNNTHLTNVKDKNCYSITMKFEEKNDTDTLVKELIIRYTCPFTSPQLM